MYHELLANAYDRGAPEYDARFWPLQRVKYAALLGARGERLVGREALLDVGCGTGLLAEFLREVGVPVGGYVGVDLSEGMLEIARGRGLRVARAAMERLPFAEGSFDAVACVTVLRIMPSDERAALRALSRALRPGGLLALSVLAKDSDDSLDEYLREANFSVLEVVSAGQDVGRVCERLG